MATKPYYDLNASETANFAANFANVAGPSPASFNLTASDVSNVASTGQDLQETVVAAIAAETAYREAQQAQTTARAACQAAIAASARLVYAKEIAPSLVASLGLKPRTGERQRLVPVTPTEFTVTPQPNGMVRAKWNRFGNAKGVIFVVEARAGSGPWTFSKSTQAASVLLPGVPGQPMELRVMATRNNVTSPPSTPVSAYPSVAPAAPASPESSRLRVEKGGAGREAA